VNSPVSVLSDSKFGEVIERFAPRPPFGLCISKVSGGHSAFKNGNFDRPVMPNINPRHLMD
jgi:hypothetical protein